MDVEYWNGHTLLQVLLRKVLSLSSGASFVRGGVCLCRLRVVAVCITYSVSLLPASTLALVPRANVKPHWSALLRENIPLLNSNDCREKALYGAWIKIFKKSLSPACRFCSFLWLWHWFIYYLLPWPFAPPGSLGLRAVDLDHVPLQVSNLRSIRLFLLHWQKKEAILAATTSISGQSSRAAYLRSIREPVFQEAPPLI